MGIHVFGANAADILVERNYVGTDFATGTASYGNTMDGIRVDTAAHRVTIGPNNVIVNNTGDGIHIANLADDVTIIGNRIAGNGGILFVAAAAIDDVPAPVITNAAIGALLAGTAPVGTTVDVYAGTASGALCLVASGLMVDGMGLWINAAVLLSTCACPALTMGTPDTVTGLYATATNASGSTSPLSGLFPVP